MSARVVVLADVRASRARVAAQVSVEPPPLWLAWYAYWTGDMPKSHEQKAGEIREFVRKKCLNG